MRARFGRDIYCQECGKDDEIVKWWMDKFSYGPTELVIQFEG